MFTLMFLPLLAFLIYISPISCMATKDLDSVFKIGSNSSSSKPSRFWLMGLPKAKGTNLNHLSLNKGHILR